MWHKMRKLGLTLGVLAIVGLFFVPQTQAGSHDEPIEIGWTAWSDAEAVTKMARTILEEEMGYEVELTMADIGVQYEGLAGDDLDIMLMAWLPVTHQDYWETHVANVDNLGPIYTRARLGWVVPDYVPEDELASIEDMTDPDVRAQLDSEITGIDPGAGLMRASEDALEEYGLQDYNLIASSGAGMTSAIERAVRRDEWIVATGWSPHWKFAAWDLRYLEDPKNTLGAREKIHALAREDFYQDVPVEVYEFFTRYYLPLDELEEIMYEARETSYEEAIDNYMEENPERVNYWITGQFN